MTQQPNTIATVRNTRARIGTNNYELHIPKIEFGKNDPKPVGWQGGTPEAYYQGATPATDHVAKITIGHDYQNEDSAYAFFRAHPGEEVELEWKPDADGAYTVTTTITVVAPNPGGDYGKQHDSVVTCPCTPPVDSYDDAAAPVITSHLSDGTLATAGGEEVLLEGTGFASATDVKVGGVSLDSDNWDYLGAGRIVIYAVPAHGAGAVAFVVVNPTGASAGYDITYA